MVTDSFTGYWFDILVTDSVYWLLIRLLVTDSFTGYWFGLLVTDSFTVYWFVYWLLIRLLVTDSGYL